eukprot:COSAG04_NODE_13392_length_608_cov_0.713163_1_plen_68_part_10
MPKELDVPLEASIEVPLLSAAPEPAPEPKPAELAKPEHRSPQPQALRTGQTLVTPRHSPGPDALAARP